jgi:hypothetical protein
MLVEQELELYLLTCDKPSVARKLRGRSPVYLLALSVGPVQVADDYMAFDLEATFVGDRDHHRLVKRSFDPLTVLAPFELASKPELFGSVFHRGVSWWRTRAGGTAMSCRLEAPLPLLEYLSFEHQATTVASEPSL